VVRRRQGRDAPIEERSPPCEILTKARPDSRRAADTATMNIWLHKEVMKKLAENGGKVPQELLSR
jgi:hypothetical protein